MYEYPQRGKTVEKYSPLCTDIQTGGKQLKNIARCVRISTQGKTVKKYSPLCTDINTVGKQLKNIARCVRISRQGENS